MRSESRFLPGTSASATTGTRFAGWSRSQAIALVVVLLVLLGWGLLAGSNRPDAYRHPDPNKTDAALYTQITNQVVAGQGYYHAVDSVQAQRGFPTRPFVTVREPALASVTSWVGGIGVMRVVLVILGIAVVAATILRLETVASGRPAWWCASAISALAVAPIVTGDVVVIHEVWAGLLLTLALTLSPLRVWWISLAVGFGAVIVRELALPLFALMIVFEFVKGSYTRALAWTTGVLIFFALLAIHATNVAKYVSPSTTQSAGWLKFGGWPFFVDSVRFSSIMQDMPVWVAAVVVPLALLGWLSRPGDFALRTTALLGMFAAAYAVVGRPANTYWGLLFVALLLPGFGFAPGALKGIWDRLRLA